MSLLDAQDVENLSYAKLLTPVDHRGTRRIHRRCIADASDIQYRHLPFIPYTASNSEEMYATIPDRFISRATLEHIGFNETRAASLWELWANSHTEYLNADPDDLHVHMSFLEHATDSLGEDFVYPGADASGEDDQKWFDCMTAWGIATNRQEVIMDPEFRQLRLAIDSCLHWVLDTLGERYLDLMRIRKDSKTRATMISALLCPLTSHVRSRR
jgi:hypothetical protein